MAKISTRRITVALLLSAAILLNNWVRVYSESAEETEGEEESGGDSDEEETSPTASPPLILAHRGASGYLPEHTLAAYALALELGADYIEPDLQITSDGVFVSTHSEELSISTDVAARPEFANRKRTVTIYGRRFSGWFVPDFNLTEIKTLRVRQLEPQRSKVFDSLFEVPTLQEIIDLVNKIRSSLTEPGRTPGLDLEVKIPTYYTSVGLDPLPLLEKILADNQLPSKAFPIIVQSFEAPFLKAYRNLTRTGASNGTVPLLVQLVGINVKPVQGYTLDAAGLDEIATYANGIGPEKELVVEPSRADRPSVAVTDFVKAAHARHLVVHPWELRSDHLDPAYKDDPLREYQTFFEAGVDGLFTEFPDAALRARDRFLMDRMHRQRHEDEGKSDEHDKKRPCEGDECDHQDDPSDTEAADPSPVLLFAGAIGLVMAGLLLGLGMQCIIRYRNKGGSAHDYHHIEPEGTDMRELLLPTRI